MIPHLCRTPFLRFPTLIVAFLATIALMSAVPTAAAHALLSNTGSSDSTLTQIVTGNDFSCGLTSAGGVLCWGENYYGNLGNGTNLDSSKPVAVMGLNRGITQIIAAGNSACALRSNGTVACWGSNLDGELGNGTTTHSSLPVEVTGLANVVALGDGDNHACAILQNGTLWCWGANESGQLGDGSQTNRLAPVMVQGLAGDVSAVDGGRDHTCAMLMSGAVQCWGDNSSGQVDSEQGGPPRLSPVDVAVLPEPARQIAAGYQATCAVTQSDSTYCWGFTFQGRQGGFQVPLNNNTLSVAVGFSTMCAVKKTGGILCKAWINEYGNLGDGTIEDRFVLGPVKGIDHGATTVSVGDFHVCTIVGGSPFCWGNNGSGQVGDGRILHRALPLNVLGLAMSVTQVAAGGAHTCVVTTGGGVQCWGDNIRGQLGNGREEYSGTPVDVEGLASGVAVVVAGNEHTCALIQAGGVKCWGYDRAGQLGNGGDEFTINQPADVVGLTSGVKAVAAGGYFTCALTDNGAVKCWGENSSGELGNGTTIDSSVPVDVTGLQSGVKAIALGFRYACALLTSGEMRCWGDNVSGQLGDETTEDRATPVVAHPTVGNVTSMALGYSHTCVLLDSRAGKCWGGNSSGQLGDGTTENQMMPVDIAGLDTSVLELVAGGFHTCARLESGAVKCWGANQDGQLGNGSARQQSQPMTVTGLAGGVAAIGAGSVHTCAQLATGAVRCWGNDSDGQLGIGSLARRYSPAAVVESPAPELHLNYSAGQPGSIFTLTGFGFPAEQPVMLQANGISLSATVMTGVEGGFIVELLTDEASTGYYSITGHPGQPTAASTHASATISFSLDLNLPKRVREGMAETLVTIPEDIAVELRGLYLPAVVR